MTHFKMLPALVAAMVLLVVPAARAEPHPFAADRQVTVMTQNLYLGTDLRPIFAAPNLPALASGGLSAASRRSPHRPRGAPRSCR